MTSGRIHSFNVAHTAAVYLPQHFDTCSQIVLPLFKSTDLILQLIKVFDGSSMVSEQMQFCLTAVPPFEECPPTQLCRRNELTII